MTSAPFSGWIDFCALKLPMGPDYQCLPEKRADPTPSEPVSFARCDSKNHRLLLTRRPS